jgi:hypothetical protein
MVHQFGDRTGGIVGASIIHNQDMKTAVCAQDSRNDLSDILPLIIGRDYYEWSSGRRQWRQEPISSADI